MGSNVPPYIPNFFTELLNDQVGVLNRGANLERQMRQDRKLLDVGAIRVWPLVNGTCSDTTDQPAIP